MAGPKLNAIARLPRTGIPYCYHNDTITMADPLTVSIVSEILFSSVLIANQTNGHEALEEKLGRLSRKPGVKASIVLDRATGSILKTSGQISSLLTSKSRSESTAASFSNEAPAAEESENKGLEDFAAMIWNYVNTSGTLVQELDTEVSSTGAMIMEVFQRLTTWF